MQDITIEYATALTQSAMDRTSTGKAGKLQAEDVLFVVRKVRAVCPLAARDNDCFKCLAAATGRSRLQRQEIQQNSHIKLSNFKLL